MMQFLIVNNPSVQVYVNKSNISTVFKIKRRYKLELLSPKTMKLLGSKKERLIKIKFILEHYSLVNKNYQAQFN